MPPTDPDPVAPLTEALDEVLRPYLRLLGAPDGTATQIIVGASARLANYHGATLDAARAAPATEGLREDALAEAIFRVGIGHRKGMTALPWAVENQQEFARWCDSAGQIVAEYARLASSTPPTEPRL
jgi:hypothetical protein